MCLMLPAAVLWEGDENPCRVDANLGCCSVLLVMMIWIANDPFSVGFKQLLIPSLPGN